MNQFTTRMLPDTKIRIGSLIKDEGTAAYVEDDQIAGFFEILVQSDSKFARIDSLLFQKKTEVKNIAGYIRSVLDTDGVETVLFPVCRGYHWTLLIFDKTETARYYDPLGSAQVIEDVKKLYDELDKDLVRITEPLQRDLHNCGIFVMKVAEALVTGLPWEPREADCSNRKYLRKIRDEIIAKLKAHFIVLTPDANCLFLTSMTESLSTVLTTLSPFKKTKRRCENYLAQVEEPTGNSNKPADYLMNVKVLCAAHPNVHFGLLFDTFKQIFEDRKTLFDRVCGVFEEGREEQLDIIRRKLFDMVHVEEAIEQWAKLESEEAELRAALRLRMAKELKKLPTTASVLFLLPTLSSTLDDAIEIQGGWGGLTSDSDRKESDENPNAYLEDTLGRTYGMIIDLETIHPDANMLFNAHKIIVGVYEALISHIMQKIGPLKGRDAKLLIDKLVGSELVKKQVEELNRVTDAVAKRRRATYMAKEVLEQILDSKAPMIKVVFSIPTTSHQIAQYVLEGTFKLDETTSNAKVDASKIYDEILDSL